MPKKKITVSDHFVAYGSKGIEWADGYIDGIHFVGYPNHLLGIRGKMTEEQKEVAREFCRKVFDK